MPTLPTFDELYETYQGEVQARDADLTDWSEGSANDALGGGGAALADEVIRVLVELFAGQFVDTAKGEDLDALLEDRFGLERNAAAAAVGELTFTRGSAVGVVNIPAGTQVSGTVDGETVTVTTDTLAQIPAADSTVTVNATCTETGSVGNVAAGVLTSIDTEVPDDPDLTVTNAGRFAGGAAEESDSRVRDRARRYFQTLRKGTVEALEAGALSVAGVDLATVDESAIAPEDGGYVSVYIGDPDARASQPLVDAVETELDDWRAAGVRVVVQAAEREEIDLELTIYVTRGADQATLREDVQTAVLGYINGTDETTGLPIAATLRLTRVAKAAMSVSDDLEYVEVDTPTSDPAPSAGHYAIRVPESRLQLNFQEV